MKKLTVGSCFSGIGGLELGLEWTGGFETKWQIEIDPFASAVLRKHWPRVKRYADIRTIDTDKLERVDLICGGYPCQPFSLAGKRQGARDPRHLWPDMSRIILHLRPRIVLLENVPGHLSMGFDEVLRDLAECGYDAEWGLLSAAGVGAPHLRRRLFVIANAQGEQNRRLQPEGFRPDVRASGQALADTKSERFQRRLKTGNKVNEEKRRFLPSGCSEFFNAKGKRSDWWSTEPDVGRVAHGVPSRVDRLKCLGNAVVPQVAQKIGEMILNYERGSHDRT